MSEFARHQYAHTLKRWTIRCCNYSKRWSRVAVAVCECNVSLLGASLPSSVHTRLGVEFCVGGKRLDNTMPSLLVKLYWKSWTHLDFPCIVIFIQVKFRSIHICYMKTTIFLDTSLGLVLDVIQTLSCISCIYLINCDYYLKRNTHLNKKSSFSIFHYITQWTQF